MSLSRLVERTDTVTQITDTTVSSAIDCERAQTLSVQCVVDVNTPAAADFTATPATDICTATAHGFPTGLKGQASSTTTLPAGLSAATDYFVIAVSANTFKLAASLANAQAGTAINITDAGTGTHTFTPTAVAGANVRLQKSNDNSNWSDEGSVTNITADGTVWLEKDAPSFRYARVRYTLTAGSISASNYVLVKG